MLKKFSRKKDLVDYLILKEEESQKILQQE